MNWKSALLVAILFSNLLLSSCGGKKVVEQSTIDSLAKISPDLARLSNEINAHPDKAESYYERGVLFYQFKMLDYAAKDVHRAIELDSTQISYYLSFADINVEARYLKVAAEYLLKAEKIAPQDKDLKLKLAKIHLYLKEYDKAIAYTNTVSTIDPNDDRPFLLQGIIWKEKGDTMHAIKTFLNCAERNPDNYDAYMQLGLLSQAINDKKAEAYFLNTLRIDSSRFEGPYALAMYYQNSKQVKKAMSIYRSLIIKHPQEPNPMYNMGYLYFGMDSIKIAYNHFTMLIQTDPMNIKAYYMRGLCNLKRGVWNEAVADFSQVLKLNPDF
jgi:tetratricopeptide (TPR) repeat protein